MCKLKLGFVVVLCVFGFVFGCSPGGKIVESSKTPECAADIVGALQAFTRDRGLAFNVSQADAQTMFAQGTLEKSYGRDGASITCHFGFEVTNQGCNLKFYKKSESKPGSSSSSSGNYGTVALSKCQCAK